MADKETEEWAKKTRLIEAERAKAAKAINETKPDKTNLAYLDPRWAKVRGFSRDPNLIRARIERLGDKSVILAIAGAALGVIADMAVIVTAVAPLGAAGAIIVGIPGALGAIGITIAIFLSVIIIVSEIVLKIKTKRKFTAALWSALATVGIVILFVLLRILVLQSM